MVERQTTDRLSVILKAASEPTRRAILTLLAQEGPMRVTDIHSQFTGSLNAISKHIKVLERAGLVARKTDWREHLIEIQMAPLTEIDDWFEQLRSIWEIRLDALNILMTTGENTMNDLTLTVERTINAPQKDVFNAWLNPDMLRQFMMPAPGTSVSKASNDPKTDGRFDIVMKVNDNEIPHSGTYREITPYERIVFTWESPFSVDDSTVTLTFMPKDQGTHITLTHIRFADAEARDNHKGGWTGILEALNAVFS